MKAKSTISLFINNKKVSCLHMELPLIQKEPKITNGCERISGSCEFTFNTQTNKAFNQLINRSLIYM